MKNKIFILATVFAISFTADAWSNDNNEMTNEQIKRRLKQMKQEAAKRYEQQEEYLEKYVSKLGEWVSSKRENYQNLNEQQQNIVKKSVQEYKILAAYLKNFKRLNRVRGSSEEGKYFSRLGELKKEYKDLTGENIPRKSKNKKN